MNEGYVKIYRKMVTSQVFQNEGLFKVWMWCLLKANHEGRWVPIKTGKGTTEVWVEPGQFIFGRKSAAKELKMHPETVRKRIHKLKKMGNLTIESTTLYSIVTIVNWALYQGDEKKVPSKVPAKYQPSTTNKNDKNDKDIYAHFAHAHFDDFWNAYPKKVDKKRASKVWEKLKPDTELLERILIALAQQKQSEQWKKDGGQFIPYPTTWLNGHRWKDEIQPKEEEEQDAWSHIPNR